MEVVLPLPLPRQLNQTDIQRSWLTRLSNKTADLIRVSAYAEES